MHIRMSIALVCLFFLVFAGGCQAGVNLKPIAPALGECKGIFAERLSKALKGFDSSWPRDMMRREILAHLPRDEMDIFISARKSEDRLRRVSAEEIRVFTLEKIEDGFRRKNFCGTSDAGPAPPPRSRRLSEPRTVVARRVRSVGRRSLRRGRRGRGGPW